MFLVAQQHSQQKDYVLLLRSCASCVSTVRIIGPIEVLIDFAAALQQVSPRRNIGMTCRSTWTPDTDRRAILAQSRRLASLLDVAVKDTSRVSLSIENCVVAATKPGARPDSAIVPQNVFAGLIERGVLTLS